MTIMFYKVGDFFTKKFSEAVEKEKNLNCRKITLYAEYPLLEYLKDIPIEELTQRYLDKDVKYC